MRTTTNSEAYGENLALMAPGDSFFVDGKETKDLMFLYRVAREAGIKISIRKVVNDEIYMSSGVRVWRTK